MDTTINPQERWMRIAAELQDCRVAEQEAWGGVDEMTLARYLADLCTQEERNQIEAAISQKPDLLEVISVLSEVLPGRNPEPIAARPAVHGENRKGIPSTRSLQLLAASVLLAFGLGWFFGSRTVVPGEPERPGELLIAKIEPDFDSTRSTKPQEEIPLGTRDVYRIGRDFNVSITSPRDGWATIVLIGEKSVRAFPNLAKGQTPIKVEAYKRLTYGPLPRPDSTMTVLIICSSDPSTARIQELLPPAGATPHEISGLTDRIREALVVPGKWASIDRINIEPPSP